MGQPTTERWREDRRLVERCLKGETAAWETLIVRYRRLIYSVPNAYRLSPDDADDVFQRVAVKLLQNLQKLRRVEGLASWLMTTTRRECQALGRGAARWASLDDEKSAELVDDPPDVLSRLEQVEAEHALALALESLDPVCRQLLTALYLEDPPPSYDVLGKRLGRPIGSLGPTRSRCLGKLRRSYRARGGRRPWGDVDDEEP